MSCRQLPLFQRACQLRLKVLLGVVHRKSTTASHLPLLNAIGCCGSLTPPRRRRSFLPALPLQWWCLFPHPLLPQQLLHLMPESNVGCAYCVFSLRRQSLTPPRLPLPPKQVQVVSPDRTTVMALASPSSAPPPSLNSEPPHVTSPVIALFPTGCPLFILPLLFLFPLLICQPCGDHPAPLGSAWFSASSSWDLHQEEWQWYTYFHQHSSLGVLERC